MGIVVVGVDGSDGGQEALRLALGEARLRGARLRVVTVWHMPTMAYGAGPDVDPALFEEGASAALDAALTALGERATGIEIERVMSMGQPAAVLVEEARGADLLVVGSRGHGGFVGLLLGSVSHECAMHASCPVLIAHQSKPTS